MNENNFFGSAAEPRLRKRWIFWGAIFLWACVGVWNTTRPMPPGTDVSTPPAAIDAADIRFLTDLTYTGPQGPVYEQQIFDEVFGIIERAVTDLADAGRWRIHPVGALDLLPVETAQVLKAAADSTRDVDGMLVNVAVGYGGRREIADAVRSLLQEHARAGTTIEELAEVLDVEHIAEHLYTKGQPDPDLVIRTSGEQRLGGFLLWQSAHSEFYFCEAYWPAFRKVDFLRALRAYGERRRRFGA